MSETPWSVARWWNKRAYRACGFGGGGAAPRPWWVQPYSLFQPRTDANFVTWKTWFRFQRGGSSTTDVSRIVQDNTVHALRVTNTGADLLRKGKMDNKWESNTGAQIQPCLPPANNQQSFTFDFCEDFDWEQFASSPRLEGILRQMRSFAEVEIYWLAMQTFLHHPPETIY